MIAVRRLQRSELERRLAPYQCTKRADICHLTELWVTGWDEPFTLCPDEDDYLDDFDYKRVLFLISKTMPPGWSVNG